jgi:hypothetical protein
MTTSEFQRSWVRSHSTQNIGMAVEPEKGGKLAHECLLFAFLARAKTRIDEQEKHHAISLYKFNYVKFQLE